MLNSGADVTEMKYWLAVGTPQNWKTAFDLGNTWGLKSKGPQATNWKQVQIGDTLIFYAVSPVKGIIGYGVVQQKLKQDTPLWPEESAKKEVIWPLRLIFEVRSCLSPDRWLEDKVINDRVSFRAKMGFREIGENLATEVLAPFQSVAVSIQVEQSVHSELVDSLLEIGRLQSYLTQKEYPMGKSRLDAVWRRVQRSVPNFVFEVQVGGNLYQALAKLKHAHDIWNSNIYLVLLDSSKKQLDELLSGTFHEIRDRVRVIDEATVRRLVNLKKEIREIESRLGLTLPAP
ncbi:MAG TPA: EVE domain-containing protein [Candidatus Binatia bacterium]